MNQRSSVVHPNAARPSCAATTAPHLRGRSSRCSGAGLVLASLLSLACLVLIAACGGGADSSRAIDADHSLAWIRPDVPVRVSTAAPEWAPDEMPAESAPITSTKVVAAARKPISELWSADGRARITLPEDWPADTAAHWSGQRYATRAQLDHELITAAPYTLVIDADDEAAVETGLQYADTVNAFAGGKALLGVFVRSRQPALAARLAERLTAEQGWANVFVVI